MFNLFNIKANSGNPIVFRLAVLIVFFVLTILILTSALTVNAQLSNTFEGDIVPCGVGKGPLDCQFCHLQTLAHNIINFLVFFAIVVAVLMFVFAGFLLVTAGANEGQLSKGKSIFWTVFIGLFIILAAWLIIDVLMKTFLNEGDFGPWNKLECAAGTSVSSVPGDGDGDGVVADSPEEEIITEEPSIEGETLSHGAAKSQLQAAGVTVFSSGNCSDPTKKNCTSLNGVRQSTIDEAIALKIACGCTVVVTGGTETGHTDDEDGIFDHANGYKIDVDKNVNDSDALTQYIKSSDSGFILQPYTIDGNPVYISPTVS